MNTSVLSYFKLYYRPIQSGSTSYYCYKETTTSANKRKKTHNNNAMLKEDLSPETVTGDLEVFSTEKQLSR